MNLLIFVLMSQAILTPSPSGLLAGQDVPSDTPDPPPVLKRLSELERRVADLEKKSSSSADPKTVPLLDPPPLKVKTKTERLTYAQGVKLAMETGKPLIVWVGGDVCERCVEMTASEFIHVFVDALDGAVVPSIVVGVKDQGTLIRAADVTWWIEGDKDFGHVPSIRSAIRRWRDGGDLRRTYTAVGQTTVYQTVPMSVFAPMMQPPPVMQTWAPMTQPRMSAGCTSCGR